MSVSRSKHVCLSGKPNEASLQFLYFSQQMLFQKCRPMKPALPSVCVQKPRKKIFHASYNHWLYFWGSITDYLHLHFSHRKIPITIPIFALRIYFLNNTFTFRTQTNTINKCHTMYTMNIYNEHRHLVPLYIIKQ